MPNTRSILARNLDAVRDEIEAACTRVGRDPQEVTLVAVTKRVGPELVAELASLGVRDFGENRVPELLRKRAALAASPLPPPAARWHMIGHLQRNKLRGAVDAFHLVHSADSTRLLTALDAQVQRTGGEPVPVLLQVNVSGEASKGGFAPCELDAALLFARKLSRIHATGLMTMAPAGVDSPGARGIFRRLCEMRDGAQDSGYVEVRELSMGMSGDYVQAIEQGATLVRLGTTLFRGIAEA